MALQCVLYRMLTPKVINYKIKLCGINAITILLEFQIGAVVCRYIRMSRVEKVGRKLIVFLLLNHNSIV